MWDDHDFAYNDANGVFEGKKEAQQVLLDFLDLPSKKTLQHLLQSKADKSTQPSPPSTSSTISSPPSSVTASSQKDPLPTPQLHSLHPSLYRAWLARREQEGAYNSHILGVPGRRVKVVLLDNR